MTGRVDRQWVHRAMEYMFGSYDVAGIYCWVGGNNDEPDLPVG
jgi:hypothetical protein